MTYLWCQQDSKCKDDALLFRRVVPKEPLDDIFSWYPSMHNPPKRKIITDFMCARTMNIDLCIYFLFYAYSFLAKEVLSCPLSLLSVAAITLFTLFVPLRISTIERNKYLSWLVSSHLNKRPF